MSDTPFLVMRDVSVRFGKAEVVKNASLEVAAGEILGLIGESGSGKSMLAKAAFGLLPTSATVTGSITVDGEEIMGAKESQLKAIRGRKLSMIFQNPGRAFNPFFTIGSQACDIIAHATADDATEGTPKELLIDGLERVHLPNPADALVRYPHQFSGGQLQRISIAIALACSPKLLIADEPTTALDVTIQAQILELIRELVAGSELAVLFITHDLGVLAALADRVAVMRRGVMMETQPSTELYKSPQTDYTRDLLAAVPQLDINPEPEAPAADERPLLLEVSNLVKTYESARGPVHAVRDLSFCVREGESVAVVGESGSGKSTAAMAALKLTEPTSGKVIFMGEDFINASHRERRLLRRNFGVVFQNPYSSLNPRMRIAAILSEALKASGDYTTSEINTRIADAIKRVGLSEAHLKRYPNAFSGGQRQRIAIARALVMGPKLIILDEPTAALDVLVQAQVLELLEELRVKDGLSYLFITHDLAAVPDIASRVLVMYQGEIVESGPVEQVFAQPQHSYTQTLLDAIPVPDPERAKRKQTASG